MVRFTLARKPKSKPASLVLDTYCATSTLSVPMNEIQEVRCVFLELQDLEWQNTGLQGMEWQNAELQNLELQNMEARNTDLHNSDLRNSDLQNADLQNTDPRDPELQNPEVRNEDSQDTPSWDAPPVSPHNVPKPGVTFHTRCASCGEAAAHDQPWRAEVWADIHEFEHIRDAARHIWQRRFYDFNVWTERKRIEKLRYMHRNPVKRGLVASPELWKWSSFRAYSLGEAGSVKVNAWEVLKMKIRPPAA
jgi:hypothetical protein